MIEAVAMTDDAVLGGRVRLRQPRQGYRVAIDPILLAAAVPAAPGQRILELGCGVGAAALCLARRVPDAPILGLDIQSSLVALADENAAVNGLADRARFVTCDVAAPPPAVTGEKFDHVMANPPHRRSDCGTHSLFPGKAIADVEGAVKLDGWLAAMIGFLRPKGRLTLIHRAERLDEVLHVLHPSVGDIVVYPLWPKAGEPAKRMLISGRLDVRRPSRLAAGLTLHAADGRYTAAAEAILRDGAALVL